MSPDVWRRADEIFHEALERPPAERHAHVARRCRGDLALRREVCSLLDVDPEAAGLLDDPAVDLLTPAAGPAETAIGPYQIVRELGRGGGGVVYLGHRADGEYRKSVAIKVLEHGLVSPRALQRFRAERQILANFEHPNIAKLFEGGTTSDHRPYIVMEYVDGEAIDVYCRRVGLQLRQRLELFLKVCAAVQFAHRNLVIHRDLKPGNILVAGDGEPKLLDFGIAKIVDPEASRLATTTGLEGRPMTPQYASPEQVEGGSITTATDVYALGLVLFELLTGERPLELTDASPARVRQVICRQEPVRPSVAARRRAGRPDSGRGRTLPSARSLVGDLDSIVLKALRKEPEHRYATVERLAADLVRHLQGRAVQARRWTLPYRVGKLVRRNARVCLAAAVLAFLVAGFTIDHELQARRTEQARQRVEAAATYLAELFLFSQTTAEESSAYIPRELLDRGAAMLSQLEEQPDLRTDLMTAIGRGYLRLGLTAEAAPLVEGAFEASRQTSGEGVSRTADRLFDLAWLRTEQGRYKEAENVYRQILSMKEDLLGREHPEVASVRNALAAAIMDQGRYREAAPLFRQALETKRRELGDDHPRVSAIAGNLAATLYYRGHYQEAESLFLQILTSIRQRLPDDDVQVVAAKINLAATLRSRGDYSTAETLLQEVLTLARSRPPTLGLGMVLEHLATNRLLQGDHAGARRLAEEAVSLYCQLVGSDHPNVARAGTLLARVLLAEGAVDEAETLLRRAETIYHAGQSPEHWRRAETASLLGACFLAQGRVNEARDLLRSSYRQIRDETGDLALPAREAAARLAAMELALGQASGSPS